MHDLDDAIRAGQMLRGGHLDGDAMVAAVGEDFVGVGCYHETVEAGSAPRVLIDPFDHRASEDVPQHLARQTVRPKTRRYDSEHLPHSKANLPALPRCGNRLGVLGSVS